MSELSPAWPDSVTAKQRKKVHGIYRWELFAGEAVVCPMILTGSVRSPSMTMIAIYQTPNFNVEQEKRQGAGSAVFFGISMSETPPDTLKQRYKCTATSASMITSTCTDDMKNW